MNTIHTTPRPWTAEITRGASTVRDADGMIIMQTGAHGHLAPSDRQMEEIVYAINTLNEAKEVLTDFVAQADNGNIKTSTVNAAKAVIAKL